VTGFRREARPGREGEPEEGGETRKDAEGDGERAITRRNAEEGEGPATPPAPPTWRPSTPPLARRLAQGNAVAKSGQRTRSDARTPTRRPSTPPLARRLARGSAQGHSPRAVQGPQAMSEGRRGPSRMAPRAPPVFGTFSALAARFRPVTTAPGPATGTRSRRPRAAPRLSPLHSGVDADDVPTRARTRTSRRPHPSATRAAGKAAPVAPGVSESA
jgi:hypothetical protein